MKAKTMLKRIMALALMTCMVLTFAPAAYAAAGKFDASVALRAGEVWVGDELRPNGGYTVPKQALIEGTFTVNEQFTGEDGVERASITITDVQPYIDALNKEVAKYDCRYVYSDSTPEENLTVHFKVSATSGWILDPDYYTGMYRSRIYANRYYNVSFKDGVGGAAFTDVTLKALEDSITDDYPEPIGSATIPAFAPPARPGYMFTGWQAEDAGVLTDDGKAVKGDTVFTAQWEACTAHDWDEGTVTKEATCQTTGVKTYTCKLCGETKTETLPQLEHVLSPVIIKEATAKTRGTAYKQCDLCGCYMCMKDGKVQYYTATKYAIVFYYYLPYTLNYQYTLDGTPAPLAGNFRGVSVTNDLYGSEGLTEKYPDIPAKEAPVGYNISEYIANRYKVLKDGVPGYGYTPGNDCTGVWANWLNDTETDYNIIAIYLIAKPEVSVAQKGKLLTAEIANSNENLAYSYQWSKDGAAIEGATAESLSITCADEGAKFSVTVTASNAENSVIALVNEKPVSNTAEIVAGEVHTPVTDPAVPATCEDTGLTEGSHCKDCGAVIVAQEETPALGHNYGPWADAKDGKTHVRVCANDPSHVQNEKHSFGNWVVTKEATKTENGSQYRVCSVCGYKETAVIPAGSTPPKTGDESGLALWASLAALSVLGMGAVLVLGKKRTGSK